MVNKNIEEEGKANPEIAFTSQDERDEFRSLHIKGLPFPRYMLKEGFNQIFSKLPRQIRSFKKTFRDYVKEERSKLQSVAVYTIQEQISVFQLSTTSSEQIFMRCLARIFLQREKLAAKEDPNFEKKLIQNDILDKNFKQKLGTFDKFGSFGKYSNDKINDKLLAMDTSGCNVVAFSQKYQNLRFEDIYSRENFENALNEHLIIGENCNVFKNVTKRKLQKLVEKPGRVALDVCRCPLIWKLMLKNENDKICRQCYIAGHQFVAWSKGYHMEYINKIKDYPNGEKHFLNTVFNCRKIGLRLRTLPEEIAIFVWDKREFV